MKFAEAWNFGPYETDARPVQWIVEHLTHRWGEGAHWELDDKLQPHEATYLKLDCSKAMSQLGWRPRWRLETALAAIVDWHKAHRRGEDMREKTVEQIQAYQMERLDYAHS